MNKELLERITITACTFLMKNDEEELSRILAASEVEYLVSGYSVYGIRIKLPLEAVLRWDSIPDSSREVFNTCLRHVCFGHLCDQNGNEIAFADIQIKFCLKLMDAPDDWRSRSSEFWPAL